MTDKKKGWKEGLLRSGVPLENDVRTYLVERGCIGRQPHSYVRRDVAGEEREHSYDIDSSYIDRAYFFDLMVECKYRHSSTKWLFTPASYGVLDEDNPTDFLHPQDHFSSISFQFQDTPFPILAPLCEDGIELTEAGPNDHTITHGVAQLLHAMPGKIVEALSNQLNVASFRRMVFFRVPILVTTADLFRLREGVTLFDVRDAEEIGEVADQVQAVVLKRKAGAQLRELTKKALYSYMDEIGEKTFIKSMNTFTTNPDHFIDAISSRYSSTAVAVVQYDRNGGGLKNIIDYLTLITNPTDELIDKIAFHNDKLNQL